MADWLVRPTSECLAAELLWTDALDGSASPAEVRLFELHLESCAPCRQEFAAAQQGVASLELLKETRPVPSPELLHNILAQTCGAAVQPEWWAVAPAANLTVVPGPQHHFLTRLHFLLQPRLVMTAATSFCSLALTLSLTGVHPGNLRASDFSPSGVGLAVRGAEAGVVHYYDNVRMIRVLESHLDGLREDFESEPAPHPATPSHSTPSPNEHGRGQSRLRRDSGKAVRQDEALVASVAAPLPLGGRQ